MSDTTADTVLDVSGLLCPLPVLRARKTLANLPAGSIVVVIATDPMASIDMPHFCAEQGHELIESGKDETHYRFRIRKK